MKNWTGNRLKLLAMATMLVDHSAIALFSGSEIYEIMRIVGRLAFPIFAFLLAEGAAHTKNIWRYAARLMVFAFLSEIPYDLLVRKTWWYCGRQNIFFTLTLAILFLAFYQEFWQRRQKVWVVFPLFVLVILADVLQADYGLAGLILILAFYFLRRQSPWIRYGIIAMIMLFFWHSGLQVWAMVSLLCLFPYNGKRGRSMPKYLGYIFYPAHLCVLVCLRWMLC